MAKESEMEKPLDAVVGGIRTSKNIQCEDGVCSMTKIGVEPLKVQEWAQKCGVISDAHIGLNAKIAVLGLKDKPVRKSSQSMAEELIDRRMMGLGLSRSSAPSANLPGITSPVVHIPPPSSAPPTSCFPPIANTSVTPSAPPISRSTRTLYSPPIPNDPPTSSGLPISCTSQISCHKWAKEQEKLHDADNELAARFLRLGLDPGTRVCPPHRLKLECMNRRMARLGFSPSSSPWCVRFE